MFLAIALAAVSIPATPDRPAFQPLTEERGPSFGSCAPSPGIAECADVMPQRGSGPLMSFEGDMNVLFPPGAVQEERHYTAKQIRRIRRQNRGWAF